MKPRAFLIPAALLAAMLSIAPRAAAQTEARIWTGIFTNEQAERGKTNFYQSCVRCHGQNLEGATAPSLNGNRFITAWENENLYKLFVKVRDTMPPNFGTILTDEAKLDVITFLLRTNGYPAGPEELKVDVDTLENIQVVRKGARAGCVELFRRARGGLPYRGAEQHVDSQQYNGPGSFPGPGFNTRGIEACRSASSREADLPSG